MTEYKIENKFLRIDLLDVGATMLRFIVKKLNRNIVLTNKNLDNYKEFSFGYIGCTVGRVGGRISKSKIKLDGKDVLLQSQNKVFLHGGVPGGFSNKEFNVLEHKEDKIVFSLESHEESNFPGTFKLKVTYELKDYELFLYFDATCDKDTPVNIINHAYFNLTGEETIRNHEICIDTDYFQEVDSDLVATGKLLPTDLLGLNNKGYINLGQAIDKADANGYNGIDNYFFTPKQFLKLAASDIELTMEYTYPGTVLYTTNMPTHQALESGTLSFRKGLAIEPEFPCNALNLGLDNALLKKGEKYHHITKYSVKLK